MATQKNKNSFGVLNPIPQSENTPFVIQKNGIIRIKKLTVKRRKKD